MERGRPRRRGLAGAAGAGPPGAPPCWGSPRCSAGRCGPGATPAPPPVSPADPGPAGGGRPGPGRGCLPGRPSTPRRRACAPPQRAEFANLAARAARLLGVPRHRRRTRRRPRPPPTSNCATGLDGLRQRARVDTARTLDPRRARRTLVRHRRPARQGRRPAAVAAGPGHASYAAPTASSSASGQDEARLRAIAASADRAVPAVDGGLAGSVGGPGRRAGARLPDGHGRTAGRARRRLPGHRGGHHRRDGRLRRVTRRPGHRQPRGVRRARRPSAGGSSSPTRPPTSRPAPPPPPPPRCGSRRASRTGSPTAAPAAPPAQVAPELQRAVRAGRPPRRSADRRGLRLRRRRRPAGAGVRGRLAGLPN